MAVKVTIWEIKIGSDWVDVSEKTFVLTMRIRCECVKFVEGKTRVAVFLDKNGYAIGKMYAKEV